MKMSMQNNRSFRMLMMSAGGKKKKKKTENRKLQYSMNGLTLDSA